MEDVAVVLIGLSSHRVFTDDTRLIFYESGCICLLRSENNELFLKHHVTGLSLLVNFYRNVRIRVNDDIETGCELDLNQFEPRLRELEAEYRDMVGINS